ncbi:MAG TPA: pentapeptide repeat-containing protein [Candidatus Limnocylindrales bacterium]|nr:pentapeptide repeat-containing protein [Candidatus Limnocylindrales bacterium]
MTREDAPGPQRVLSADCERCVGLCCVAPLFVKSAEFAFDKFAGDPCPNLAADNRCGIHARLRASGFPGCVTYDCFGAGQRVSSELLPGADWRADAGTAAALFTAFDVVRPLHELLWYLEAALALDAALPLAAHLRTACAETDALAGRAGSPGGPGRPEVDAHRGGVAALLRAASVLARAPYAATALDRRGADLVEADLRTHDLRGADLRGAEMLGADLRGLDLDLADLTGADLRAADLRGTDLGGALFVTGSQLESATGDPRTRIPRHLARPAHWG